MALHEAVTFDSGSVSGAVKCVSVTVNRDNTVEYDEEFIVELTLDSRKECLSLENNVTVVTLVDSDSM